MLLKHQKGEIPVKEIKVPELAESITEGTIAEWLVNKGDKVEKGDAVLELETDKVNVEVNSDFAGIITELVAEEGDDVSVGDTIAKVDENAEAGAVSESKESTESKETESEKSETTKAESADKTAATAKEKAEPTSSNAGDVIASPAARKLARELDIDLSKVKAQDPLGRIRTDDVEAASKAPSASSASSRSEERRV